MIQISRDLNANVLYLGITDALVAETVQVNGRTLVNLASDGTVKGIEIIGHLRPQDLAEVLDLYGFEPADEAVLRALIAPESGTTSSSATVLLERRAPRGT